MKLNCRSLTFVLLLTAVNGFVVGPQTSRSTTQPLTATLRDDSADASATPRDVVQGLAVSALFGLAMIFNPLPSLADGKKIRTCFCSGYSLLFCYCIPENYAERNHVFAIAGHLLNLRLRPNSCISNMFHRFHFFIQVKRINSNCLPLISATKTAAKLLVPQWGSRMAPVMPCLICVNAPYPIPKQPVSI